MGAVHGCYLKYVALSAISYGGYTLLADDRTQLHNALGYSAILNGVIALLMKSKRGVWLIGKNQKNGQIPFWSYVMFSPFHIPTMLYTYIHTKLGVHTIKNLKGGVIEKVKVPVASQVQKGWWVGGCYSHELNKKWGGVIDLTNEFPERCINQTQSYMLVAAWDGVPATPLQLEEAAIFAVEARKKGDVLIHCAHGRGRSTTMMCAALVKAGMYDTWQDAFSYGIKPKRPVCKLNSNMRKALTEWQVRYENPKQS